MTLFRLLCLRVMKGVSVTASHQLSDATLLKVRGSGTLVTAVNSTIGDYTLMEKAINPYQEKRWARYHDYR